jgi:hypothetical protein
LTLKSICDRLTEAHEAIANAAAKEKVAPTPEREETRLALCVCEFRHDSRWKDHDREPKSDVIQQSARSGAYV